MVGGITVPDRQGSGFLPDHAASGWRVRPVPAADVWPIRHQVLRPGQPLERSRYAEDDRPDTRHFAALDEVRGTGAGSALLRTALTHAALAGAAAVWCKARTSVADFYRKHGFQTLGEEFEIPGTGPHSFMY